MPQDLLPKAAAEKKGNVDAQVSDWFDQEREGEKKRKRITDHQHRVYNLVKTVPAGSVTTYGAVAKALNPRSHARAIGQAMRSNPYGCDVMP
jgi:O6-methylguanine-DNA--protein-cysteine methyltransferase